MPNLDWRSWWLFRLNSTDANRTSASHCLSSLSAQRSSSTIHLRRRGRCRRGTAPSCRRRRTHVDRGVSSQYPASVRGRVPTRPVYVAWCGGAVPRWAPSEVQTVAPSERPRPPSCDQSPASVGLRPAVLPRSSGSLLRPPSPVPKPPSPTRWSPDRPLTRAASLIRSTCIRIYLSRWTVSTTVYQLWSLWSIPSTIVARSLVQKDFRTADSI